MSPSTWNLCLTWPTPSEKHRLQPISGYNVWTVRASENVQLQQIRSRPRTFQRAIDEVCTLPLTPPHFAWSESIRRSWPKRFIRIPEAVLRRYLYRVAANKLFPVQRTSTSGLAVTSSCAEYSSFCYKVIGKVPLSTSRRKYREISENTVLQGDTGQTRNRNMAETTRMNSQPSTSYSTSYTLCGLSPR